MKYVIVGNNDGPQRLWKSLKKAGIQLPERIGLQKIPDAELYHQYQSDIPESKLFVGFDETQLLAELNNLEIDCIINCYANFRFTTLLKRYQCINIHPSLLPKYRGRHPMHWALINGETTHGITVHKMNEKFDDGAILWQKEIPISEELSVQELRELLMQELENAFPSFVRRLLNHTLQPIENKKEQANYIRKRNPKDSELTTWNDSEAIYRKINALRSEAFPAYISGTNNEQINIISVQRSADLSKKPLDETNNSPKIIKIAHNHLYILFTNGTLLFAKASELIPPTFQLKITNT